MGIEKFNNLYKVIQQLITDNIYWVLNMFQAGLLVTFVWIMKRGSFWIYLLLNRWIHFLREQLRPFQDIVLINESKSPPVPAPQPWAFLEGTAYAKSHTAPQTTLSTNWWLTHHCEMDTVNIIISSLEKQEPRPENTGSVLSSYWGTKVEFNQVPGPQRSHF